MPDFASSTTILALLMGGLGLVIGSFLAAVSVRLPLDEDVVARPSRCRSCETPLKPWHMVPVLSWLVLRGRCGHCGSGVHWRYPAIELASAGLGAWAAIHGGGWLMIGATALLGWQLLLIALVDGEHFWLPDILTWPLAVTGLIANGLLLRAAPVHQLAGVLIGFVILWGLARLYRWLRGRDGLGGGDPILFAACGAWVGWMGLPSVLLWACAVGLSLVLAMLLVRRRVSGTDRVPFGVFLAVGCWLTWLYGPLGV